MIPDSFIRTLLDSTDIVEIIGSRVQLKKRSGNYVACCPFHNEKTPSFNINVNKQFFHCFGCGVNGDIISFIQKYEGLDFREALTYLASMSGLEVPKDNFDNNKSKDLSKSYQVLEYATKYFYNNLKKSEESIQYLKKRNITGKIARDFLIGYANPSWDDLLKYLTSSCKLDRNILNESGLFASKDDNYKLYDRFRDRIIFPIRNKLGKFIGFGARALSSDNIPKYLNSPETNLFNKKRELYGVYEARSFISKENQVLIVEGYMDVVALADRGVKNVVATLGTACTEDHIKQLFKIVPNLIFCFDGDIAGRDAAFKAVKNALPYLKDTMTLRVLILPRGEDPDSYIQKIGSEQFVKCINKSLSWTDFLFSYFEKTSKFYGIDGKVLLIQKIKPILELLPNGAYKALMEKRLSDISGVDLKSMELVDRKTQKHILPIKNKPLITSLSDDLVLRILGIILLYSQYVDVLFKSSIFEFNSPIICMLKECAISIKKFPTVEYDELRAFLSDASIKYYDPLKGIMSVKMLPKDGIEQELSDSILKLESNIQDLKIECLLQKAHDSKLSDKELEDLNAYLLRD